MISNLTHKFLDITNMWMIYGFYGKFTRTTSHTWFYQEYEQLGGLYSNTTITPKSTLHWWKLWLLGDSND
jgi:hypothetical protein